MAGNRRSSRPAIVDRQLMARFDRLSGPDRQPRVLLIKFLLPNEDLAVGFATVIEKAKGTGRLQRPPVVQLEAIVRRVVWILNDRTPNLGDRLSSFEEAVRDDRAAKIVDYYPDNFRIDLQGSIPIR